MSSLACTVENPAHRPTGDLMAFLAKAFGISKRQPDQWRTQPAKTGTPAQPQKTAGCPG
jgi:hypothetical protein